MKPKKMQNVKKKEELREILLRLTYNMIATLKSVPISKIERQWSFSGFFGETEDGMIVMDIPNSFKNRTNEDIINLIGQIHNRTDNFLRISQIVVLDK